MLRKILTIPNLILTTKAKELKEINKDTEALVLDMIDTCRKAEGIGLAAPQIGLSIRLCIINLEHLGINPFPLINPKITKRSWKKIEMEEGCLSIPGIFGIVKRPKKITIKALNLKGEEIKIEADDMLARVIQHEIDHLDGILFISKIVKLTKGTIPGSM
jgi:peptide deformylase